MKFNFEDYFHQSHEKQNVESKDNEALVFARTFTKLEFQKNIYLRLN